MAKGGLKLTTQIDVPLPVRGSPVHLKQILLLNAVHYLARRWTSSCIL